MEKCFQWATQVGKKNVDVSIMVYVQTLSLYTSKEKPPRQNIYKINLMKSISPKTM